MTSAARPASHACASSPRTRDTCQRASSTQSPIDAVASPIAAVAAIAPNIPTDHASVGIEVNIKHISATPIGENIVAMAEVTRLDDKRVYLEVRAWDENEMIGVGTHTRYLVNVEEFEA